MELRRLVVPAQIAIPLRALDPLSSEEGLDGFEVEVEHDLAEVRVLDNAKEVAVDEADVGLVVMVGVLPADVLYLVGLQELLVAVVDVLVLHEVLVGQDEHGTLDLLREFGGAEGEQPRIKQDYLGHLLL